MAQMTVTVPDPEVPRVQAAIGQRLNHQSGIFEPRVATAEEVRQFLVDHLIQTVREVEREAGRQAADSAVTDIGAT
jgi:hypothetical protein